MQLSRYVRSKYPIVAVVWHDASHAATEKIYEDQTASIFINYKPGVIDETVGFLVASNKEWLILADSRFADSVAEESNRAFRSIRNIPRGMVISIKTLRKGS